MVANVYCLKSIANITIIRQGEGMGRALAPGGLLDVSRLSLLLAPPALIVFDVLILPLLLGLIGLHLA